MVVVSPPRGETGSVHARGPASPVARSPSEQDYTEPVRLR